MLGRTSVGALGAITAALALAALASQAPHAKVASPAPVVRQPTEHASTAALEALRDGRRIDLNSATAADLELLPGIGPSLARRIVDDRSARGAFGSIAALGRVRGIGPRTIGRLEALVEIRAPEQGSAPAAPSP